MKKLLHLVVALSLAASLLCLPNTASAAAAQDITKNCNFTPSSNAGTFKRAHDGRLDTVWKGKASKTQSVEFTVSGSIKPGGFYFRWDAPPPAWTLYVLDDKGLMAQALTGGGNEFLTDYVALPEMFRKYKRFRLASADGTKGFAIAELSVFGEGAAPFYAPTWKPLTGRADVMVFSAHPDDDVLFMGSVIPTYSQQGKSAVTVFMTYDKPKRRIEGMEGAWTLGERICPVMGPFPDTYSPKDVAPLKRTWPEEKALAFIVEQIRRYKPSVIVTHDVNGEYGHGAHKWTSALVQKAFSQSGDPACFPASAKTYGTWKPAKLYLHIYKKNKLTIDTRVALPLFGGKTAFEVAKLAYTRHMSQHKWSFAVRDTGAHSIREFGLFGTLVGQDTKHTDMFENVAQDKMLELNPWYNYAVVDRAALTQAIARASAAKQADYTMESWAAAGLPAAIASAKVVLNNKEAPQAKIDTAAKALDDTMAKLVPLPVLTGISIASLPEKLVYQVGEPLDLTGLAVTGTYSDGAVVPLTVVQENVTGFDSSAPAAGQALTVAWEGKTASFTVDIKDMETFFWKLMRWLNFIS